jgi:hypothetical protein
LQWCIQMRENRTTSCKQVKIWIWEQFNCGAFWKLEHYRWQRILYDYSSKDDKDMLLY